jgi:chemotaxis protein histidine kinase CheA
LSNVRREKPPRQAKTKCCPQPRRAPVGRSAVAAHQAQRRKAGCASPKSLNGASGARSFEEAASDGTKTNGAAPKARVLKVDQAKLDTLMNLAGELVLSKNSVPFLARRAEEIYSSREMARRIKRIEKGPKQSSLSITLRPYLMSIEGTLPRAGLGVSKASNGEEALNILKGRSKPDMIIADLNMAAMNGIQLIREIRRLPGYQFTPPRLVAASSSYF